MSSIKVPHVIAVPTRLRRLTMAPRTMLFVAPCAGARLPSRLDHPCEKRIGQKASLRNLLRGLLARTPHAAWDRHPVERPFKERA